MEMDCDNIVRALQATTSAANQREASDYLEQNIRQPGFAPMLLHIVMDAQMDCSVRQASVIYLKNTISRGWDESSPTNTGLTMEANDKEVVRNFILPAIVASPQPIRVQLCAAIGIILRADFPERWPDIVDRINKLLQSVDGPSWLGSLLVLRQLVKIYEYRRAKEKKVLTDALTPVMPLLLQHFGSLMVDASQESCLLQGLIMKIFYGLIQFSLPLEIFDSNSFTVWLNYFRAVIERPVPPEVESIDMEDRPATVWWKCKKWASSIVMRIFERYGSPGQVQSTYTEFAEQFMATSAIPLLNSFLTILDNYHKEIYVSPRVLHASLHYISTALAQSRTWQVVKPHAMEMCFTVLFNLLKYSDSEEELWNDSPEDYTRFKFDVYDELHSPSVAAGAVLSGIVKRKGMLPVVLEFVYGVLGKGNAEPKDEDGGLHMLGELAVAVMKSKSYKNTVEKLMYELVLPRLTHNVKFIRARACWVIKMFSDAKLSAKFMKVVFAELVNRLSDQAEELPVKVEAAIAIQFLLEDQDIYRYMLKPHVRVVIIEILRLVSRAEIEELTGVMEELLEQFVDDVIPIAAEVAAELANIFLSLSESQNPEVDTTVTVMGVLSTVGTILEMVEDNAEVLFHIEEEVRRIIKYVVDNSQLDYYEEILSIANSLMSKDISTNMWDLYLDFTNLAKEDGDAIYGDLLPVLHTYMTVDTDAFLARPERLEALIDLLVNTFMKSEEYGVKLQAVKMFECVLLQLQGRVNKLVPGIIQMALNQMQIPMDPTIDEGNKLKIKYIILLFAGIYYDVGMFLEMLPQLQPLGVNTLNFLVAEFLTVAKDMKAIHDRKVSVVGICTLLRLRRSMRPVMLMEKPLEMNTTLVHMLTDLQKALQAQAERRAAADSDEESEESETDGARKIDDDLDDNEDEIDDDTLEYLETVGKYNGAEAMARTNGSESNSDGTVSDTDYSDDEISVFTTPLDNDEGADAFIFYKETLDGLLSSDPQFFKELVNFDSEMEETFNKLVVFCDRRLSLAKSKEVERRGGYAFPTDAHIPTSFNFSGGNA